MEKWSDNIWLNSEVHIQDTEISYNYKHSECKIMKTIATNDNGEASKTNNYNSNIRYFISCPF